MIQFCANAIEGVQPRGAIDSHGAAVPRYQHAHLLRTWPQHLRRPLKTWSNRPTVLAFGSM